jgi:hypothetical protein
VIEGGPAGAGHGVADQRRGRLTEARSEQQHVDHDHGEHAERADGSARQVMSSGVPIGVSS